MTRFMRAIMSFVNNAYSTAIADKACPESNFFWAQDLCQGKIIWAQLLSLSVIASVSEASDAPSEPFKLKVLFIAIRMFVQTEGRYTYLPIVLSDLRLMCSHLE